MGIYSKYTVENERMKNMKLTKRIKTAAIAASAAAVLAVFGIVLAQEYSAEDPLISKSYLDSVFYSQITQYVDEKVASAAQTAPAAPAQSTDYQVITLQEGQTLYAKSSLEFILRPGASAIAVSPSAENGIANVSHGVELMNGYPIPINVYCVIPRGDGRGIQCLSDTAYIMVRGQYEIR